MPSDMKTVYRAASVEEADIIVAWLDEQGIAAMVKDRAVAGTIEIPTLFTPRGIEVCVPDPEQAKQAVAALKEHYAKQAQADDSDRVIEATCEACGKASPFPQAQHGLVQNCPHCNAYLDVPEVSGG
ncbi:MAG: DUF2007 domain-containing protein [bacterium]|nr:DUF2007 domain-containing protein [bacterium]